MFISHTIAALIGLSLVVSDIGQMEHPPEVPPSDTTPTATGSSSSQIGRFRTSFPERSPYSSVRSVAERFRVQLNDPPADYVLDEESFEVYVPPAYEGSEPFGLLVWIHAGPDGAPPDSYLPILDKHTLIWVGANHAGNQRSFWHRAGLALDARHNMIQRYTIDPMRVYVAGLSGGGRSASRVGLTYADLFAGAFSLIGTDFFTRLPHPDSREMILKFWAPAFNPPQPYILRRAKRDGRYVLLTGENDGNRAQTLITYRFGYVRGRFQHVTYLEVPDMGHELPPAEWFEKGIVALDQPLPEIRARREAEANRLWITANDRLTRSSKHGIESLKELLRDYPDTSVALRARKALQEAINHPGTQTGQNTTPSDQQTEQSLEDIAREKLALARNYLDAGKIDLARELLRQIVTYYPDTRSAVQAKQWLDDLEKDG